MESSFRLLINYNCWNGD